MWGLGEEKQQQQTANKKRKKKQHKTPWTTLRMLTGYLVEGLVLNKENIEGEKNLNQLENVK